MFYRVNESSWKFIISIVMYAFLAHDTKFKFTRAIVMSFYACSRLWEDWDDQIKFRKKYERFFRVNIYLTLLGVKHSQYRWRRYLNSSHLTIFISLTNSFFAYLFILHCHASTIFLFMLLSCSHSSIARFLSLFYFRFHFSATLDIYLRRCSTMAPLPMTSYMVMC